MTSLCKLCSRESSVEICELCLRREKKRVENQNERSISKEHLSLHDWLAVLKEYDYCCKGCKQHGILLTLDHKVPMSKGGGNTKENIVPLCSKCHEIKGTIETKLKGNKKKRQEGKELKEIYPELF